MKRYINLYVKVRRGGLAYGNNRVVELLERYSNGCVWEVGLPRKLLTDLLNGFTKKKKWLGYGGSKEKGT